MVESHTVIPEIDPVLRESKATAVFFISSGGGEAENEYHIVDILHMVGFVFKLLAS